MVDCIYLTFLPAEMDPLQTLGCEKSYSSPPLFPSCILVMRWGTDEFTLSRKKHGTHHFKQ